MNGSGRRVTVTRHEWVLEGEQHASDVYQVLTYMEDQAGRYANVTGASAPVWVEARDGELIVFYVEEKAKPAS